jgi:hypothetical protein
VIAIGGNNFILGIAEGDEAGADGFLTNVEVEEATDMALLVKFGGALFDAADEDHLAVEF